MPANGRWDLIRRLKVNELFFFMSQKPSQSQALSLWGGGSHYGDQFKDFELRRAFGTHFEKEMYKDLCFGNLKLRDHSGDLSVDGK